MKLSEMLNVIPEKRVSGADFDFEVKGVVYDPLRVEQNYIFIAINIYTQLDKFEIPDGHTKVFEAIRKGAKVVILQEDLEIPEDVVKIIVPDSRYLLGLLANELYGHPSKNMKLIGITGTNGKTTTTHIVESIFIQDYKMGLIGTLYYKMNGEICQSKDTTPEPTDLQEIFRKMADDQFDY